MGFLVNVQGEAQGVNGINKVLGLESVPAVGRHAAARRRDFMFRTLAMLRLT